MTSDSNSNSDSDADPHEDPVETNNTTESTSTHNSASADEGLAGRWLVERYPKFSMLHDLPDAYEKFTVDAPDLVECLQQDFLQMSGLRAGACYDSVTETIAEHLGSYPVFESIHRSPNYEEETARRETLLTSFLIGHKLDETTVPTDGRTVRPDVQVVMDASVVGIFESPIGETGETVVWTNPDLLEYDYVVLCQVVDDVIYSGAVNGGFTTDRLPTHLASELSVRRKLLTEKASFYKAIYTSTIDSILNEHYESHY